MAGLFELLEALTSGFGQVLVPGTIVVSGKAMATAANVLAHELLFRLGLAAAVCRKDSVEAGTTRDVPSSLVHESRLPIEYFR